jgi:hypothetical protein
MPTTIFVCQPFKKSRPMIRFMTAVPAAAMRIARRPPKRSVSGPLNMTASA